MSRMRTWGVWMNLGRDDGDKALNEFERAGVREVVCTEV